MSGTENTRAGTLIAPEKLAILADAARWGMKRRDRKVVERTVWATLMFDYDVDPGHTTVDQNKLDLLVDHVSDCMLNGIEWRIVAILFAESQSRQAFIKNASIFTGLSKPAQSLILFIQNLPDAKSWWTLDAGDWNAV